MNLGTIAVVALINQDDRLVGGWTSSNGTEGVFSAKRDEPSKLSETLSECKSVFIVHGHDEGLKHQVARFLGQQALESSIEVRVGGCSR